MTKHLHYVVPIFLIGLIAGAVPASAALRSDGGTRDPVAAPAESTDAPIILAQRGGGRGGGGRGGGGGMRAGGGGARGGYAGGAEAGMPEEREAGMPAGLIAVLPPGAATGPAFPQATAASTPVTSTAPTSTLPMSTETSTFPAAVMAAAITAAQAGAASPPASQPVPSSALPRPRSRRRITTRLPPMRLQRLPIARTPIIRTAGFINGLVANSGVGRTMGCDRPQFHALLACGSPKQTDSSRFCSHTVQAPAKPNPFRSHSMASNPRIVRRAVWKD